MVRHRSKTMIATMENRRLEAARVLAGMTQRELARVVGTREIEISRIETGRVQPKRAPGNKQERVHSHPSRATPSAAGPMARAVVGQSLFSGNALSALRSRC